MSNTKSKTEIFEELSPKYFYDVSPKATVKFLNSEGYNITTLDELDDNAIAFLCNNKLGLYKFALERRLHNKPLQKVSPGEEQLPTYYDNKSLDNNYFFSWYRGISELLNSYSTIHRMGKTFISSNEHENIVFQFIFNGFDEDDYFYYEYSSDSSKKNIIYSSLEEVHFDSSLIGPRFKNYYDEKLHRDRYFKFSKVISIDK